MPFASRTLHASAAARDGAGVLVLGAPGAGKSDLVLRLVSAGFVLIADDQVRVSDGIASPPDGLAGLLEVRGLGIVRLAWAPARLVLVVRLGIGARLPEPARLPDLDLPVMDLDPAGASAVARLVLALDCLAGRVPMVAGVFA